MKFYELLGKEKFQKAAELLGNLPVNQNDFMGRMCFVFKTYASIGGAHIEKHYKKIDPDTVQAAACAACERVDEYERKKLANSSENLPEWPPPIPEFPTGLTVVNQFLGGPVQVTRHAWARFCKRYPTCIPRRDKWDYSQAFFVERLAQIFSESTEEELSVSGTIKRLLDNELRKARYFRNKQIGLRFVVSEGSSVLLTVEIPTQV